jgi:hypothetical protein
VTVPIFSRHKTTLPGADEALPGRDTVRPDRRQAPRARRSGCDRRGARGIRGGSCSASAASGAPRRSTGRSRSPVDLRRLRRRLADTEPDVRRSAPPHGPHRGRPGRVRPGAGGVRRPGEDLLRGDDPTKGCAGATTWACKTGPAIYWTTPEQERQTAREPDEDLRRRFSTGSGSASSPPRCPPRCGRHLLLRRGPPPAVSRKEPVRVPLPREHRVLFPKDAWTDRRGSGRRGSRPTSGRMCTNRE